MLRQLRVDHVSLEPTERDGERVYAYRGRFTFGRLFEGTMCPQLLASLTGFESSGESLLLESLEQRENPLFLTTRGSWAPDFS